MRKWIGAFCSGWVVIAVMSGQLAVASSMLGVMPDKARERALSENPRLPRAALERAESYLQAHPQQFRNRDYLTIVNFDQPSTEERLYLIDTRTGETLTSLVAHGVNSADPRDQRYAVRFSNQWNSFQSSLGVYMTFGKQESVHVRNPNGEYDSPGYYRGSSGWALRITGLESSNSEALNREIVVHADDRISESYIHQNGYLGLTAGCPAVEPQKLNSIIDRIAGRSLLLLYRSARGIRFESGE